MFERTGLWLPRGQRLQLRVTRWRTATAHARYYRDITVGAYKIQMVLRAHYWCVTERLEHFNPVWDECMDSSDIGDWRVPRAWVRGYVGNIGPRNDDYWDAYRPTWDMLSAFI